MCVYVKLQLTKDKTIDISLPSGGAKSVSDITGVELFPPDSGDFPAVRLVYRKKAWHVAAAGTVKAPNGELPTRWEDTPHQPTWELPRAFQSPRAALAVNSEMGSFSQTTADAVVQEMMTSGQTASPQPAAEKSSPDGKRRFGVRRDASAPKQEPAKSATSTSLAAKPLFPKAGEAVSSNGRRFTVRPMVEDNFHLCTSLPEFQTLWLSRLLPEGRRPTASSIQLAESALMASILLQPEFIAADGSALAVFVRRDAIFFAGYRRGEPVLWRKCPGVGGSAAMRDTVRRTLGIDEDLVDTVLNDSLIDPRPALEPFMRPVLDQLALSLDYLSGKQGLRFDHAFLMGLGSGAAHWLDYAERSLHVRLVSPDPFEGLAVDKGVEAGDTSRLLVALGAAIAGAEVMQ